MDPSAKTKSIKFFAVTSNALASEFLETKEPKIQGFRKIWLNYGPVLRYKNAQECLTKQGRTSSCSFYHVSFAAVFCFNRFPVTSGLKHSFRFGRQFF